MILSIFFIKYRSLGIGLGTISLKNNQGIGLPLSKLDLEPSFLLL